MVQLLFAAGNDTTVSLIANGTPALLTHPSQPAALHAAPARWPAAIEELLRFDSPAHVPPPVTTAERRRPLARLEGRIALRALFDRFPGLEPAAAPESLRREPALVFTTLAALPVRLAADPSAGRGRWSSGGGASGSRPRSVGERPPERLYIVGTTL